MRKKLKGISTYVATVILVVLAVGVGVSLFLYFSGYLTGITGTVEEQQQEIFECAKVRLDIDYYSIASDNLTVRIVNIGGIGLKGNFSIRVEHDGGTAFYVVEGTLPVGGVLERNVTGLSNRLVTKVIVTPLDKCQIPFSKVKEVRVIG